MFGGDSLNLWIPFCTEANFEEFVFDSRLGSVETWEDKLGREPMVFEAIEGSSSVDEFRRIFLNVRPHCNYIYCAESTHRFAKVLHIQEGNGTSFFFKITNHFLNYVHCTRDIVGRGTDCLEAADQHMFYACVHPKGVVEGSAVCAIVEKTLD